jgi:hypothetical protein
MADAGREAEKLAAAAEAAAVYKAGRTAVPAAEKQPEQPGGTGDRYFFHGWKEKRGPAGSAG